MSEQLEILGKWRQAYTMMARSGFVGTEKFLRDSAEAKLLHRVELSAVCALLLQKKIFTQTELVAQIEVEAEALDVKMQELFPGFRATLEGLVLSNPQAGETIRNWDTPYGMGVPPAKG